MQLNAEVVESESGLDGSLNGWPNRLQRRFPASGHDSWTNGKCCDTAFVDSRE